MIEEKLNLALKTILQSLLPFVGVSLLVVWDFLQLPPIKQNCVLMKSSKDPYIGHSHEVVEIVGQSGDPDFSWLLFMVWEV